MKKWWMTSVAMGAVGVMLNAQGAPAKPNILFIVVDDLRPQLGCYGEEQMISPNIDRLASSGVLFTRATCQVPVCGASRASLLTGMRPTPQRFIDFSAWAEKDAPGKVDLPGWLKQHGYQTYSMGKVYQHPEDHQASWTQLGSPLITRPAFADYHLEESKPPEGLMKWSDGAAYECADAPEETYFQYQLADAAIARLQAMKQDGQPAFLAVGFTKPHLPFVAPKKYWDLYDREQLKLAPNPFRPQNAPSMAMHTFGELRNYRGIPRGTDPIPDDLALTLIHGYYACVSYTDAMIGRVLDELDRLNMRENTIIVLWGDHGWQLGEHGLWCKHALFDTSLNAPLLVSAPGYTSRGHRSALVEFVDVYPTLCELAGLPLPNHLEGSSMVPLLRDPNRDWKTAAFARYHLGDTIRTDRYSYSEWKKDGVIVARMLYDHENDPMENVNLAEDPKYAGRVSSLSRQLAAGWKPVAQALKED